MKIGALAKAVNCHVETVRYYEKQGLLPPCTLAENGYGEYSESHLKLLRLIRYAKELGFSQVQVRELMGLTASRNMQCGEARQLINVQMDLIKGKIEILEKMQETLIQISKDCSHCASPACTVFDEIMDGVN